jgi:hypothetical protein
MVFGSGDGGIWALQPRTGLPIWKYYFSRRGVNVSPLVVGERVIASHSEENIVGTAMGAVVSIDASGSGDLTDSGTQWRREELMVGKASPLAWNGRLFLCDDRGKLHVLDLESGETIGRRLRLGTVMRASPLLADGKIYAVTANGRWYILAPDDERGAKTVRKGELPPGEEMHASPICSHGRIYLQTTDKLYCLEDPNQQHGITDRPPKPQEQAVSADPKPAHLQVVPAEVLMRPGESQKFVCRLFNGHGQLLEETAAEFTVDGGGQINAGGTFTAAAGRAHQAVTVAASANGLTGTARIRIVPPLPWSFDFDQTNMSSVTKLGEPPITWVGARYRHVIREVDGNKVMVKISTIPLGTRSRCWFGHPELSNYTIQADVMGTIDNDKMPDIGLIAQGYTLDLKGADRKLQIRTWVTQERMANDVSFDWQPNIWYRMKLRAEVDGGMAVLRGKVWPRGEKEPGAWTVEATDESPNRSGSPGLFGNAKDAELLLDNIQVTVNN